MWIYQLLLINLLAGFAMLCTAYGSYQLFRWRAERVGRALTAFLLALIGLCVAFNV